MFLEATAGDQNGHRATGNMAGIGDFLKWVYCRALSALSRTSTGATRLVRQAAGSLEAAVALARRQGALPAGCAPAYAKALQPAAQRGACGK